MSDIQLVGGDGNPFERPMKRLDSGLYVDRTVAQLRESWTKAEEKILRRAGKMLEAHGMDLMMVCKDPQCREDPAVHIIKDAVGRIVLQCGHKDRVLEGL